MYILSNTEFLEYLLAMIYFYFQNCEESQKNFSIFMEDIKKRSTKHYNAAFELRKMYSFFNSQNAKESPFEPFEQYLNKKDY